MSATKKVSKKNKRAWRKHSDIRDIEEFLEGQRLEERFGNAKLKQDEELFKIDRDGKVDLLLVSRKENRRQKVSKLLKSLAPLENTSNVLDPISKRNHVRPKNGREKIISKLPAGVEKSKIKLNRNSLRNEQTLNFYNGLWEADNVEQAKIPKLSNEWVEKDLVLYHAFNTGKRTVVRPQTTKLKSKQTRTIELPHPGMSYNPSIKDHQDLMKQVLEKESKLIKEEQHLKRVTTDMFSKIHPIERVIQKLQEDSSEAEEEGTEFDQEKNSNNSSTNRPVHNKKKPLKKRRNERIERQLKQKKKELKLEKKKITDIHRLKVIKSEVEKEEDELKEIMKRRKIAAAEKKKSTQRLAKFKFKEPDLPINTVTDLCGNLRNIKTESNILEDKFKSLQKRNILPPSVDIGIRNRSKIKRFVRSSHK